MKIRESLASNVCTNANTVYDIDNNCCVDLKDQLSEFDTITEENVRNIVMNMSASCQLDPQPTWLLKKCLSYNLNSVTRIVNVRMTLYSQESFHHLPMKPSLLPSLRSLPLMQKISRATDLLVIFVALRRSLRKQLQLNLLITWTVTDYMIVCSQHTGETSALKLLSCSFKILCCLPLMNATSFVLCFLI